MKNKRREFLKQTALTSVAMAGSGMLKGFAAASDNLIFSNVNNASMENKEFDEQNLSVIGLYGPWAASLTENKLPSFSFRNESFTNIQQLVEYTAPKLSSWACEYADRLQRHIKTMNNKS